MPVLFLGHVVLILHPEHVARSPRGGKARLVEGISDVEQRLGCGVESLMGDIGHPGGRYCAQDGGITEPAVCLLEIRLEHVRHLSDA